jgi:hypothetical protein
MAADAKEQLMRRSTAVPLGRSYLTLAALATTAGLTTACASQDSAPERQVYCGDEQGVIVDEDRCEDDDGRYFLWAAAYGRGLKPGHKLTGGTRIPFGDAAARERYGLPATGKIANGTVLAGGFGSDSGRGSGGG